MGYEFLIALAVAAAAVVGRRRGSSWWNVLGLSAPFLGIAGFAAAYAFLSGLDALLVATAFGLPTLWILFLRSRTVFAARRAPIAVPPGVDPDDPTEVMVRETDLADAAEEQHAFRGRMLRRVVAPGVVLVGTGALLGGWPLALMGAATFVAIALFQRFVRGLARQPEEQPRARRLRLRSPQ